MSLAEHAPAPKGVRVCAYVAALDRLDAADAATLTAWVTDPGMPAVHIARALKANGTPYVSDSVIGEHRRGVCLCTR